MVVPGHPRAHPALAGTLVLGTQGVLAGTGGAGTFWSGVGTPQCTVRVMSVVPSL